MSDPKAKIYVEFIASICAVLFGPQCIGFPILYFIQRSENPYQVAKDASGFAIFFVIFLVILSVAFVKLTLPFFVPKNVKNNEPLLEANSFFEFLKVSRLWILLLIVVFVPPYFFMRVISSALNAPEGIVKTAFGIVMVHFIVGGFIVTLIGVGGIVHAVIKRYVR